MVLQLQFSSPPVTPLSIVSENKFMKKITAYKFLIFVKIKNF